MAERDHLADLAESFEGELIKLFNSYGQLSLDKYINATNRNPSEEILSTSAMVSAQFFFYLEYYLEMIPERRLRFMAPRQSFNQLEEELFNQCKLALTAAIGATRKQIQKDISKYSSICSKKRHYYLGGTYLAPNALKQEITEIDSFAKDFMSIEIDFDSIRSDDYAYRSLWDTNLKSYYSALERYQLKIKSMNSLIDADEKISGDRWRLMLAVCSFLLPVISFLLGKASA